LHLCAVVLGLQSSPPARSAAQDPLLDPRPSPAARSAGGRRLSCPGTSLANTPFIRTQFGSSELTPTTSGACSSIALDISYRKKGNRLASCCVTSRPDGYRAPMTKPNPETCVRSRGRVRQAGEIPNPEGIELSRHAPACPGHPRLCCGAEVVDGRHPAGRDDWFYAALTPATKVRTSPDNCSARLDSPCAAVRT